MHFKDGRNVVTNLQRVNIIFKFRLRSGFFVDIRNARNSIVIVVRAIGSFGSIKNKNYSLSLPAGRGRGYLLRDKSPLIWALYHYFIHYIVVTCLRAFQHLCANMAIRECLNSKDDYQTAKTTTTTPVIMRSEASRQQNNNNSLSSSSTDKQLERPSNHLKEDSCKCSGCALVWFAISRSVGPSATTTECFS